MTTLIVLGLLFVVIDIFGLWDWSFWAATQLIQAVFYVLGILTLWLPCLCHAWKVDAKSIKDGRDIDSWTWRIFRWLGFGNPEDGVTGQTAKIWNGATQVDYASSNVGWFAQAWNAYKWSALRNSADDWKYRLRWRFKAKPPFKSFPLFGKTWRFGFQNENGFLVPVL